KEHILVLDEGIRVERNRGRLEAPFERPLVQRLNVLEDVLELEAARVHAPRSEGPEHERVVGVGAVSEADQHGAPEASRVGALRSQGSPRKNRRSSLGTISLRVNGATRPPAPSCSSTLTSSSSAPFAASSASSSS